eukprot:c52273_g1_i1.p1 GENE.c52273_g1_i1~~c52273_g1_i1.p1  ORF type:complete len:518 (+),score=93.53 c52273_g1_i1:38-1591(+)
MKEGKKRSSVTHAEPTLLTAITTYFNYFLLLFFAYTRDLITHLNPWRQGHKQKGYAPLVKGFEDIFIRRVYARIEDCWNRPITGNPGATFEVLHRDRKGKGFVLNGKKQRVLNLGSYNYLGFADTNEMCRRELKAALTQYGNSTCSSFSNVGYTTLHQQLEKEFAAYIGKEATMIVPMGFATNSAVMPSIVKKGDLIISDALNHASIVFGARSSGAKIQVFKHNCPESLERTLRSAIKNGQPRTGLPWRKILVVVEGIYSMEGEICRLPEIVRACKKYKAYIWLDEAHSIGCMGDTGRGVCEHTGVDPKDVDILMGTFTKSFGSVGGYVAASAELIRHIKSVSAASHYTVTMSPACVQQCLSALKIMRGDDGTTLGRDKLLRLRENSNLVRQRLTQMGCHVLGEKDSPVIPVMLYNPTKMSAFSRLALERNIAVVVVGFPATPLILSRVRFCISAGHDPKELHKALDELEEVARKCLILYNRQTTEQMWAVMEQGVQSVKNQFFALLRGTKSLPAVE